MAVCETNLLNLCLFPLHDTWFIFIFEQHLVNQIQHIPMDADFSSIIWCSVTDPYNVMITADGTLMLLTFTCENFSPNLFVARVKIDQESGVSFVNLNIVKSRK